MITEMVTPEQLAAWKQLYQEKAAFMHESRISGRELDHWFRETYRPARLENNAFREVVRKNAAEEEQSSSVPDVACYLLDGDICVGIDRASGYFHVECEDIPKAVPVWDALFLHRGLSAEDLNNYVITGQYLQLKAAGENRTD